MKQSASVEWGDKQKYGTTFHFLPENEDELNKLQELVKFFNDKV